MKMWFAYPVLSLAICSSAAFSSAHQTFDFYKGHTWQFYSTQESDWPQMADSLDKLAATGADAICIVVPAEMETFNTPDIRWGERLPSPFSDALLLRFIEACREHDLKVILKPMVNCKDDTWRAWIQFPTDTDARPPVLDGDINLVDWQRWWDNYAAYILHYAEIAERVNAEMYCVGCEMNSTEGFETKWRHLIGQVRKRYGGLVTYNPNHDRLEHVLWLDALDVIGVSAYFNMAEFMRAGGVDVSDFFRDYSRQELDIGWAEAKRRLNALVEKWNKPVLFIECGIANGKGCTLTPWQHPSPDLINAPDEQARFYTMLFEHFWDKPWFMGYTWWDWPSRLYPLDAARDHVGFAIYGKPAEAVVKHWYAKDRAPAVMPRRVAAPSIDTILPDATKTEAEPTPSDPNATAETRALYRNMYRLRDKGVMFAQQDTLAYGMGWRGGTFDSDVYRVSGQFPAVFGWDLGHLELGDPLNIDDVPFDHMKAWIQEVYRRNGVNTISWHATHPVEGSSWTIERVVDRLLPDGDLHGQYRLWLDRIAAFLGDLKGDNGEAIPVIFRPFHEENKHWFWWGKATCKPEEFVALWRFTIDYLRGEKGLHNLLICYSPNYPIRSHRDYLFRYPGDAYVDILGYDNYTFLYTVDRYATEMITAGRVVVELAREKTKIAAIAETGYDQIPDPTWYTQRLLKSITADEKTRELSWVLVWRNGRPDHYYVPYPGHSAEADFKAFADDPFTLFLSDLPPMYR